MISAAGGLRSAPGYGFNRRKFLEAAGEFTRQTLMGCIDFGGAQEFISKRV
jgi:hypothetical protein